VLEYLYDTGRKLGVQKFYQDFPELRPKGKSEVEEDLNIKLKDFQSTIKSENPIENDE
jgi:hypothetical protein